METVIKPPEDVFEILRVLEGNGFAAYAVGGCIRDFVMGKEPEDWDIASNAPPSAVKKLLAGQPIPETWYGYGHSWKAVRSHDFPSTANMGTTGIRTAWRSQSADDLCRGILR